jgi:hypothetical protein
VTQQNNSAISFPFKGIIWKLSLDASENLLVLEVRNEEDRSVNFSGLDVKNKMLLWQSASPENSWWMGLESAGDGKVYLHKYKDPQNPIHEGITVLDGKTGKEIWQDPKKTFLALSDGFVIASEGEDEDKKYLKLESKTGKAVQELDTKALFKARSNQKQNESLKNSFHFSAESPHFSKIAGFVKQITNMEPVTGMDYLEYEEQVVISFYLYAKEGLENYLLVIDEEGNIRFKECLGTHLKGIALDTFFVFGDLLIFVKEKKEIVIFKI